MSPEEIVQEARKNGYTIIGLTDHDCVDGIERAIEAGKKHGVRIIPGVEITAEKDGLEVHILGYFIDYKDEDLKKALIEVRESRERRVYDMVEKLKKFDININPEAVFKLSPEGSVGRPHLARALVEGGFVKSEDEAFRKYLGDKAPCYVRKFNLSPEETIKIILKAKGVPVYAHPKMMGKDELIPIFVAAGLRGLEVIHTDHDASTAKKYQDIAEKNNLVITGGSDYHGKVKKNVYLGKINVPYKIVEDLEKEAERVRNS